MSRRTNPINEFDLFAAAIAVADAAERAALLERECKDRPELRARVEALLAADAASHSPLDQPAAVPERTGEYTPQPVDPRAPTASYHRPDEQAGAVIAGKYNLVELIGEGGMGSVWRAKQTEPVKRFVALKLIKVGMDSKQVLARFDAERQALALMDHPNIAKVLDAGTVGQTSLSAGSQECLPHVGQPFFVMELVKGTPITEYCDKCKLTPQARLELFVQACQAIQHAHQKGIIHRDIKPSNVLVALYDDKPVVKVIDFGVAKATGGTLTEATIDTGFGGVVGTPQYMSPEQATFNNLDIDTRSDVYALGVLLYELLAGSPPFSGEELKKKGFLEILRVVREEEPPRPSTKLSTADALPSLSANRGTEPKKLTDLLRNELDWIVMKALEKDRTRRYETANGFAADVQRYLAGEPVVAHPPSTAYRLKKFVRRNKGQVIAASVVLFALVAGIAGTSWGLVQAKMQEAEARRQEGIARQKEKEANDEKTKAQAAAEEERNAKRREAERADGERKAKEDAERNLAFATKGNEILGSVFADLDPIKNYATVGDLSQALKDNLKKAVQEVDGSAIGDPLVVAGMQNTLGLSLVALGDSAQAMVVLEKARDTRKARLGPDHPDTLGSMNNLALSYNTAGRRDKAVPLYEETLKITKNKLGPDHPSIPTIMGNLGAAYLAAGQLDKALPLLEETLKLKRAKLGPDDPSTLTSMNNLAGGYFEASQLDKALPLYEETLKLRKAKLGPDHPNTLRSMGNLARVYQEVGQLDKALPLLEETLKLQKVKLGPDHPSTLTSMNNLAGGYFATGQLDKALPLLEETLKLQKSALGPDHPFTLRSMGNLGKLYCDTKQGDKAAPLIKELVAGQRKRLPNDDPRFAGLLAQVSTDLLTCDQFATAEEMLRECLAIRAKTQPDVWTTFNTQSMLGGALLGQKKYADAEPLLVKGYEGMKQREKTIPPQGNTRIPEALDRLIELYTATNKPDEVKRYKELRAKYPAAKRVAQPPRVVK